MKVCLMGVDFSNANYGCRALGYSAIEILRGICKEHGEKLSVTALVYKKDIEEVYSKEEADISYIVIKPKERSFYRSFKKAVRESSIVLDFTGGDSFSDIYGVKPFLLATMRKRIAIRQKTPFVIGPQTIGPFERGWCKRWAARILKDSSHVFVRDEKSYKYTEEISGIKPVLTTDVAFCLPYKAAERKDDSGKIKVGLNPSGLLFFKTQTFNTGRNVTVNYHDYIIRVVKALTESGKYEIHLIPHVFTLDTTEYVENCPHENDMQACFHIQKECPECIVERGLKNPMEVKSVISGMDVFSGARMHATIGSFSAGVPVIPFSYSRKFEGLFGSLNYNYIINGTSMDTDTAVRKTLEWIEARDELKNCLEAAKPVVESKMELLKNKLEEIIYRESIK